jgi:FtsZ-binding cell division protein ZapB
VEADGVLDIGLRLRDLLAPYFAVRMTREADVTVGLHARTAMANEWQADLFVSLHTNGGPPEARGAETYHSRNGEWGDIFHREAKRVAERVQRELIVATGLIDRGIKTWLINSPGSPLHGKDYLSVIRRTKMPSLLVESGFHTNPQEEALLKTPQFRQKIAQGIFRGLFEAYKEKLVNVTPILGRPQVTAVQMQEWAKKRGAHQRFIDIAPVYAEYGLLTGIRPEVLYAQSGKETAFGRFGGAVTPAHNNWAGIKVKSPTGDTPGDHEVFASPADGVRGHFNHMCAYVGLPPVGVPHDRFFVVKSLPWAGTIKMVEELGGRWAPGPDYGFSIVRNYLTDLLATKVPESGELAELRAEITRLKEHNSKLSADLQKCQNEREAARAEADGYRNQLQFIRSYIRI